MTDLPPELLDPDTPDDVVVTDVTPPRIMDPTLGVALASPPAGRPPIPDQPSNGLVVVGDSLTHGVSSGAVFLTALGWPAQVADALGIADFTFPSYGGPLDGIPLNLETLARKLQAEFGTDVSLWEAVGLPLTLRSILDENEDYWERGPGAQAPATDVRYHNLGIYGWDLRDALDFTTERATTNATAPSRDTFIGAKPEHDNDIAARSVLAPFGTDATQMSAARWHGEHGGIDTFVLALGANNALDAVVNKRVHWSAEGYDSLDDNGDFNVWRPTHFAHEYDALVAATKGIATRRVLLATVPHVTIAPIGRGVNPENPGKKWQPGSRFFPFYTDPWITDEDFRPGKHRCLTHQQARAIDSAIDQYNVTIADAVRQARSEGRDWYLLDLCGLLDSLAYRRFDNDKLAAQRNGWVPYVLPPAIATLDTRFFGADEHGRNKGGLFGLDGIHPSISGYGIVAQEVLRVLGVAGLATKPIDFDALAAVDALNARPPALVDDLFRMLTPFAKLFVSRR